MGNKNRGNNFTQKFDLRDDEDREQTVELRIHNHSLDLMFHKKTGEEPEEGGDELLNVEHLVSIDFWEGNLTMTIITPSGEKRIELSSLPEGKKLGKLNC